MHKASIWRRLGALFYDSLVSIALLMFTTACWLPFYGGNAVPPGNIIYQTSLILTLYLYFAYCWHRGQTLGMRAWRLYIQNDKGQAVSFRQTVIRFMIAPIGIITLLIGYPLHDVLSHTYIYRGK